jgi:hypothetical protein
MGDTERPSLCERCGRTLAESEPAPLCARCAVEREDEKVATACAQNAVPERTGPSRAVLVESWRRRLAPFVLAVLVLALLARVPSVYGALQPDPPVHEGVLQLGATGDACVGNLWLISSALSEMRTPAPTLACPASGRPYRRTAGGGVTQFECPSPADHGASSLRVRSDALVPEVR